MTASFALLRADLRTRWRSLLLLTTLTTVVVAVALTALAGASRTEHAFQRYLNDVRPMDGALTPEDGGEADVAGLEELDGVEAAIPFHWYAAFPGNLETEFFPMIAPLDDRVPTRYQAAPLVAGRRPNPAAPHEVALGERTARRLGVTVGSPLTLATFSKAADGDSQAPDGALVVQVVGLLRTPGDIVSREEDLEISFLTPAFDEEHRDDLALFSVGAFVKAEDGYPISRLEAELEEHTGLAFDTFFGGQTHLTQAGPTLDSMAAGLRIMALVVLLVGGTAIILSLSRAAAERLGDHSALLALGVAHGVRRRHLVLSSALAAVLGAGLGASLSVAATSRSQWGLARRAQPHVSAWLDPVVVVVGLSLSVLAIVAAAWAVAALTLRREQQVQREAARPNPVAARMGALGASISTVEGLRLAFDRGRGARTTPVTAAALAAALGGLGIMATLVFHDSLQHTIATPAVYGWGFDAVLSRDADGEGFERSGDETVELVSTDPSFERAAEYLLDLDVTVGGIPTSAAVLEDLSGHTPITIARGREPVGPGELGVGGTVLAELGLDVGDTVVVERDGNERSMEIVGVSVNPVNGDGGLASDGIALRREAADALGFDGTCADDEPCSRGYAVTFAPGAARDPALAGYDELGFTPALPLASSEVARLEAVNALPRVIAIALGVISVVTVAHAAAVTVRRRRRDLALLRVLGFSGRDLRQTVRVQVAALAMLGGTVGVVLGLALGRQLWMGVARSVSLPAVVTLPSLGVFLAPVAITLLAMAAATLSRRAAGRVPTGIVLRAE